MNLQNYRRALAEVAGVKVAPGEYGLEVSSSAVDYEPWWPDLNVAQAIQCLNMATMGQCGNVFIRRNDGPLSAEWKVRIDYEDASGDDVSHSELAPAICIAIIAALDLKSDEGKA